MLFLDIRKTIKMKKLKTQGQNSSSTPKKLARFLKFYIFLCKKAKVL